ncbi:hypothetical protein PIROE2DRAFT_12403 [Piromyces sp. E2]|nr:hypothetical protein PIROE2DRAFT_12403 [Piromyces sp. E2]|eukprot:OUM61578.1 hypothetical protein PIROE2DRAFT_12403 [Piromyces sp. E2]
MSENKTKFLKQIESLSNSNYVNILFDHMKAFKKMCKIKDPEELFFRCTLKVSGTGLQRINEEIKTDTHNIKEDFSNIIKEIKDMKIPSNGDLSVTEMGRFLVIIE